MTEINRRDFLGTTAAVGSIALGAHLVEAASELKPVRIAICGVRNRGKQLLPYFTSYSHVEVKYLCDPDADVVAPALKLLKEKGLPEPKVVTDFRVALDDPEIDAIVVATPDHWHALATVWACQAGKDVYVEKPASHNPVEGRRMVEAARKYERIVQVGTQRRSAADFTEAVNLVRSGEIGDVHMCRTWISSKRPDIGHVEVSEPPANLDFNMWAGPVPNPEYKTNLVHYDWHWRWAYGTGESGNNGIHALDIARWGMGIEYPKHVTSGGDVYFFEDDQETPDTQVCLFDTDQGLLQWEHRTWDADKKGLENESYGVLFYGTKGSLLCRSAGWTLYNGKKVVKTGEPDRKREYKHVGNFLDCIASRELPNADIEVGHRSTLLTQLANIALRTRSSIEFDGETETIVNNPAATALLGREYREGFVMPEEV